MAKKCCTVHTIVYGFNYRKGHAVMSWMMNLMAESIKWSKIYREKKDFTQKIMADNCLSMALDVYKCNKEKIFDGYEKQTFKEVYTKVLKDLKEGGLIPNTKDYMYHRFKRKK